MRPVRPRGGHGPARRARTAADVEVGCGRPRGGALAEGVEGGAYGLERRGHPVRGVRGDIGAVPQHGRVGRGAAPVVGDQPVDRLGRLAGRQSVEKPGERGAQRLGGGGGVRGRAFREFYGVGGGQMAGDDAIVERMPSLH